MLESWIKRKRIPKEDILSLVNLFSSTFSNIYKWATSNLKFVMNVLQVHMLHTLFTLLEALLPCLQSEEKSFLKPEVKIKEKEQAR